MKLSSLFFSTIVADNCDLSGYCDSLSLYGCIVKREVFRNSRSIQRDHNEDCALNCVFISG